MPQPLGQRKRSKRTIDFIDNKHSGLAIHHEICYCGKTLEEIKSFIERSKKELRKEKW